MRFESSPLTRFLSVIFSSNAEGLSINSSNSLSSTNQRSINSALPLSFAVRLANSLVIRRATCMRSTIVVLDLSLACEKSIEECNAFSNSQEPNPLSSLRAFSVASSRFFESSKARTEGDFRDPLVAFCL